MRVRTPFLHASFALVVALACATAVDAAPYSPTYQLTMGYTTYPDTTAPWMLSAFAVGDVNGNGIGDIVCSPGTLADPAYRTRLGLGQGRFSPPFGSLLNGGGADVALADIIGDDGKLDQIRLLANQLDVMQGSGDGTFQTATGWSLPPNTTWTSMRVAEVTGDGRPDVIVIGFDIRYGTLSIAVCPSTGTRFPTTPVYSPTALDNGGYPGLSTHFALGDMDGDGAADIVTSQWILYNDGHGNFASQDPLAWNPLSAIDSDVQCEDLDHDGIADAIGLGQDRITGPNYSLYRTVVCVLYGTTSHDATAHRSPVTPYTSGSFLKGPFVLTDVDGNGTRDIVLVSGKFYLLNGLGGYQFTAPVDSLAYTGSVAKLVAADVTGDGRDELLYCDASPTLYVNVLVHSTMQLGVAAGVARELRLRAPVPNPAHGEVRFAYELPERANVRCDVLDIQGRLVRLLRDGIEDVGAHDMHWDGADAAGHRARPGVYLARVRAGRSSAVERVLLVP